MRSETTATGTPARKPGQRRPGVPQAVHADARQVELVDAPGERCADLLGSEVLAVGLGEDEVGVLGAVGPPGADREPLGGLLPLVFNDHA